jgi:hypothetical protein
MRDERPEAVQMLEASAVDFVTLAEKVDEELWDRIPAWGGWSLASVAEHLALVEASCTKLLSKRLFAETGDEQILEATRGRDAAITEWFEGQETREAPAFVLPTGKWRSRRDVIDAFREHRGSNVASYRAAPIDLRSYVFEHTFLGPLDGFQWAIFLSQHLRRHVRQMRLIQAGLTLA